MTHPRSDTDFQAKIEDDPKFPKIPNSSKHWSSYKNPRIVRVSRTFGGKDRHSKVCTVKGLRDRRIRLSVPTAIQLYDLQDRLGLSQPSKVVDWLLDATKNDIDKLPPLPMIPLHQSIVSNSHEFSSNYVKEWIKDSEGFGGFAAQISAQNLFPLNNNNQTSNLANFSYNPYNFHWDSSAFSNQAGDDHRSSSDLYFFPSAAMPTFIPSFPSMENDQFRQINNHVHQNNPAVLLPTTLNLISPSVNYSKSVYSQESDPRRFLKDNTRS